MQDQNTQNNKKSFVSSVIKGMLNIVPFAFRGMYAVGAYVLPNVVSLFLNATKEFLHVVKYNLNLSFADNPNNNATVAYMLSKMHKSYIENIVPLENSINNDELTLDDIVFGLKYFSEACSAIRDCQRTWFALSLYRPTNILAIWKHKSQLRNNFEVAMRNNYRYIEQYLKDFKVAVNSGALEYSEIVRDIERIRMMLRELSKLQQFFGKEIDELITQFIKMIGVKIEEIFGSDSSLDRNHNSGLDRAPNQSIDSYIAILLEHLPNMHLPEIVHHPIVPPVDFNPDQGIPPSPLKYQRAYANPLYDEAAELQKELNRLQQEDIERIRDLRRQEQLFRLLKEKKEQQALMRSKKQLEEKKRHEQMLHDDEQRRKQSYVSEISCSQNALKSFVNQSELVTRVINDSALESEDVNTFSSSNVHCPSSLFTNAHPQSVLHMYNQAANKLNSELCKIKKAWQQDKQKVEAEQRKIEEQRVQESNSCRALA